MFRYPRYMGAVIAYMAVMITAGTLVTMYFCDMNAVDSFYFVVQTVWTVGNGDVVPSGDVGMWVTSIVILVGVVGITSAVAVVGSMILNKHTERHIKVESEVNSGIRKELETLYEWGERKGISRDEIEKALKEVFRDGQK